MMETRRAVLIVEPSQDAVSEAADAILLEHPPLKDGAFSAGAVEVAAAQAARLGGGATPIYLALPPVESGQMRAYLLAVLRRGVYGVSVIDPSSVEQARYAESLLEEVEWRNDLRAGLTAMAIWFSSSRALAIAAETLSQLRRSAGRTTWIGFDAASLATELGIESGSPTIRAARAQLVLITAAEGLPLVERITTGANDAIETARAAGARGIASTNAALMQRMRCIFPAGGTANAPSNDS